MLELRDPGGDVVDREAGPVGRLTEWTLFDLSVQLPRRAPARYVARLEIHQPDAPPRVFEWPVEVPDPTLPLEATLSLSAATAAPGDELELTIHNTGPTELLFGRPYDLQRWREDVTGWEEAPMEGGWPMDLLMVPPGDSHEQRVNVPRCARPGRHRIVKEFWSDWAHGRPPSVKEFESDWAHGVIWASVEFDVVTRASQ